MDLIELFYIPARRQSFSNGISLQQFVMLVCLHTERAYHLCCLDFLGFLPSVLKILEITVKLFWFMYRVPFLPERERFCSKTQFQAPCVYKIFLLQVVSRYLYKICCLLSRQKAGWFDCRREVQGTLQTAGSCERNLIHTVYCSVCSWFQQTPQIS